MLIKIQNIKKAKFCYFFFFFNVCNPLFRKITRQVNQCNLLQIIPYAKKFLFKKYHKFMIFIDFYVIILIQRL